MKAAFLDRDGVINEKAPEGGYIARWEEIRFLPDVFSSIAALGKAGFKIVIVTNQRGIALGKVRSADLEEIHRRMREEFSRWGVSLTGIYVCPHDLADHCPCRKPQPGLLIRAAEEHGIDLASSWMIGDAPSDIEAGRKAGCKTARILAAGSEERGDPRADISTPNLASAVRKILQLSPGN
jgi:D-glycero-D-manno-heptose 1,7-bisphosphate phosphatase